MRFLLKALPFVAFATAHPVGSQAGINRRALSDNDTSVLQLALYLEHLEFALYTGGVENFTDDQYTAAGFPAGFRENVQIIASQEATHAAFLASTLSANGVSPLPACTYTFPYTDPASFVALANMITTVGIGAYIGGSLELTDSSVLLQAAASILPNEARHDTYLRTGAGASPFPTPYETALTALWAFNLAQMFIVECPMQLPGQVVLPALKLTAPMPPNNLQPPTPDGTVLSFAFDPSEFFVGVAPGTQLYVAFVNQVSDPVFAPLTSTGTGTGTVPVPDGIGGVAFAVLTTFSGGLTAQELSSFGTLAGPAEVALA